METTLEIWSWTGFNLDRQTSIKVGDLRWSELQINFTDRGRNIWYNEEINWSFKLLSFNHSETGGTRGGSCDGYKKLRPSSVVLLIWKKCFIDGCCLADKHWDSGQKYKVEEIYYYIIILYNRKLWFSDIEILDWLTKWNVENINLILSSLVGFYFEYKYWGEVERGENVDNVNIVVSLQTPSSI